MSNQVVNQIETKAHPFELTLGQGPFRFVGFFDLGAVIGALHGGNVNGYNNGLASAPKVERGLGTCSHCGHAILNIFVVSIGDGKLFGVGSDCILKAGLPYKELTKVQKVERDRQRAQRAARKVKKGQSARAELDALIGSHVSELMALRHPKRDDKSLLDYVTWCLDNSNDGGIVFVLKRVKSLLETNGVLKKV